MPRASTIGRAELEILNYISDHHPATVREVADQFARTKGHVRTTVLNTMARLCQKGYLRRRKIDGVYQYAPREPKGQLLRRLVGDFVQTTLGGSLSPFVAYLAEEAEVSEVELEQLKRLVAELDKQPEEGKP